MSLAPGQLLEQAVRAAGLPLAASCHGEGVCGFCRVRVVGPDGTLSPPEAPELMRLQAIGAGPDERLACLARASGRGGTVWLATDYW